ncbi:hypothetical protein DXV76_13550 [Rhodobacteraceae bacterium CCMM004]|nr:hypothetical protein DXV76_13550 [Rhodobacteraceae bacterium CCMM004]
MMRRLVFTLAAMACWLAGGMVMLQNAPKIFGPAIKTWVASTRGQTGPGAFAPDYWLGLAPVVALMGLGLIFLAMARPQRARRRRR